MKLRKWICLVLALLLLATLLPQPKVQADTAQTAILTFSSNTVTETVHGAGYSVSGTTLTITASGTYRVTGQCSEGSIVVAKSLSGVTLILDNLELSSAVTAPIVVKKQSSVALELEGESVLTDNEDSSTEDTNADFEGACIKVKSGSSLTISGDGTLRAFGNAKNGLKGAAESALTVNGGNLIVQAANNAVAFDGSVEVITGKVDLTADGDGLKSEPDETDTVSPGTVTIHGGEVRIRAKGDGIHAKTALTVSGGSFDIQTMDGYQSTGFNSSTMSCKGLKASDGAEEESASRIDISGGTFSLNTADDAIHSDGDVSITFGTIEIYTGDDGIHAETALTLGTENGYERDPEITIHASYEGLEGSKIDAYSGKYYIVATDDGMNAAGGSSNGTDPFGPGGGWNPGGGPGGPGGPGWPGGPGGGNSGDYSINFYGGSWYVDCKGDGLDSNGALNLYGGDFTVLSMGANGDNSPLDADGGILVQGATVFGAGSAGMNERPSSASQKYFIESTRRSAGAVVNVSYGGSVVRSEKLVRNISYLFYSSPEMTSTSCSVETADELSRHHSNAFAHEWDSGKASGTPGVTIYTCTCGATERKTTDPSEASDPGVCEHDYKAVVTAPTCTEKGYTTYTCTKCGESYIDNEAAALGHSFVDGVCTRCGVNAIKVAFLCDTGVSVTVHKTQAADSETFENVTTAYPRDSASGEIDISGNGQVNFVVNVADGYRLESITAEPAESYKNFKLPEETLVNNGYRITKMSGDVTVTVRASKAGSGDCEHDYQAAVTAATCTAQGYTTYTCSKCGNSYVGDHTAKIAHDYKNGVCSVCGEKLLNVTIACSEGASVTVYETQKADGPKTENAAAANPRDGDSGLIDCSGEGQVNFAVKLADGYELESVTAEPADSYKNLKGPADTGIENGYRITKVKGEFTITVTAKKSGDVPPPVDKAALDKAISDAALYKEEDYTPDSYAPLKEVLEAAQAVKDDPAATQNEVDAAVKAVSDAVGGLVKKPNALNKDELIERIKAAKELDPRRFTEDSAKDLAEGIASAEKALDEAKTQEEIVAAVEALQDVIDNLVMFLFDDVQDETKFYFDPVYWAFYAEPQITNGMDATHFGPDNACTRGHVVTFLWRAAGCPEPASPKTTFTDLKPGAFYEKAVAWAVENEITKGTSATTFSPDSPCTRGQIVTFLWRFAGGEEPKTTTTPFTDLKKGAFYEKAVSWAVENEITNGMSSTIFGPDVTCTRGQVVTFLYRSTAPKESAPLQ